MAASDEGGGTLDRVHELGSAGRSRPARSLQAELEEGSGGGGERELLLLGRASSRGAWQQQERHGAGLQWPGRACSIVCCFLAVSLLAFLLAIACLVLKGRSVKFRHVELGVCKRIARFKHVL